MSVPIVADRIERMLIEGWNVRTVAETLSVPADTVAKVHRRLRSARQGIAVSRLPESTRIALHGAARARNVHSAKLARQILERVLADDLVDAVLE